MFCFLLLFGRWSMFAFFLFAITHYYFLLPATKQHFWSFGHFLIHWMLIDVYLLQSFTLQIFYKGWGCSNETTLKVIEIEMEKATRSCSSHTGPPDQYRFVSNGTFLVLSRRGHCRSVFTSSNGLSPFPIEKLGNIFDLVMTMLQNV